MAEDLVLVENKGNGIVKITLNRPEVLNALNGAMFQQLKQAFEGVAKNSKATCVILTGTGRAFCVGRDLKAEADFHQGTGRLTELHSLIEHLKPPVIAAVQGYAVAGGFELALSCDIVIAAEDAVFIDTHARVGLVPGAGNTQRLPRLVGEKKAKEIMFTSDRIPAVEAERIGLINKAVPSDELQEEAMIMAEKIAAQQQPSLQKIKWMINEGMKMDYGAAVYFEQLENRKWRETLDREKFSKDGKQAIKTGQQVAKKKRKS